MQIDLFTCNKSPHENTRHSAFHTAEGSKCSADTKEVISCKELAAFNAPQCDDAQY